MSDIATLLAESRAAHRRYQDARPRRVAFGDKTRVEQGHPATAGAELLRACRLRVEAQAQDPTFSDPEWEAERLTHDHHALLTFYADQLGR